MQYRPAHDGAALLVAPLLWVVVGSEVLDTYHILDILSTTAPVDGEAAPALLGPAHGGEQQDVEDDEGDAGQHLHEDHAEPAQTHCRYSVQIDIVFRYSVQIYGVQIYGVACRLDAVCRVQILSVQCRYVKN